MVEYGDEDLLMLSGIQHVTFCERQWALIHIEQQWADNRLTVEGDWMHQKVDDPLCMDRNKGVVTLRSVTLVSRILGLYGISDVVELNASSLDLNSIRHPKYPGLWTLTPVEYKHGKPKKNKVDEVQLCAQALCLEEMYAISIEKGFLYYGETRHRVEVFFTEELRAFVEQKSIRMHQLYRQETLPPPIYKTHCKSCSLFDICMPKTLTNSPKVSIYLTQLHE
ncbi:MAG: CRISPR-associated protein Cas4 [Tannerellaceae bacterium]